MTQLLNAHVVPTPTATIRLQGTLDDPKDAAWLYLFDATLPPFEPYDLSDVVEVHGATSAGYIFADLRQDASEETVLRTLDWLSDTVGVVDQGYQQYLDALRQASDAAKQWSENQLT